MDFHAQYGLTPIINACGKMTHLSNARVFPEIVAATVGSLEHFFDAEELQDLASQRIAAFTGAEAGFVTACTAAGITLGVAACMTGCDLARVAQLPDTQGMKNEVVIQKGHVVNFGAPVTQMVRLAGARVVEVGDVNGTSEWELRAAIGSNTAAVLFVVSHHTVRYGCVPLTQVVRIAHAKGVPVVVDAAAQDFLIQKMVQTGADILVCSGHKYLSGTVSGLACGKADLIRAMRLQNRGIGRTMKVGKEGIFGLLAAIECRQKLDVEAWSKEIAARVATVCAALEGEVGVRTESVADPNGNPFTRARVWVDPAVAGLDAATVCRLAAAGRPSVRLRAHHVDEGYFDVDVVELSPQELQTVIETLQRIFRLSPEERRSLCLGTPRDPRFSWLE